MKKRSQTKLSAEEIELLRLEALKLKRIQEQLDILRKSQEFTEEPGKDESLDRFNEKRRASKIEFDPVSIYILDDPQAYIKKFPKKFYNLLRKLNGIDPKSNKKPNIFGHYTNLIIYRRLFPGSFQKLKARNRKNENGVRDFYHHQFLTPIGIELVLGFIQDSIDWMEKYSTMHEFLLAYCREFKIQYTYQPNLFE